MTARNAARAALVEGWPVLLTTVVIGATYGLVARQSGLTVLEASASSVLVFAGASQYAMLELRRSGTDGLAIAFAIFLINARHLLMATAIKPFIAGFPLPRRLGLAYILTDEAFAMAIGWFRRGRREIGYYAVFGTLMWLSWNVSTIVGAVFGADLERPERLGIDFAITAVFVAIVAVSARHRADVIVACAAALVAAALRLAGASTLAVVIAGAIAPLAAIAMREETE
ncbi:MAG: AzlC family ABC transporter permease [Chloroflexota bacterium]